MKNFLLITTLLLLYCLNIVTGFAQAPVDHTVQWESAMQIPSPEDSSSWFPDLALDSHDNVHVVWNETKSIKGKGEVERVFYSSWNGNQWSSFIDILPPQPDINRIAIAIDDNDKLHVVNGWFEMYYRQVQADIASSTLSRVEARLINARGGTYNKDIATFKDNIYIVYDDRGEATENGLCKGCGDVFFRYSKDRGITWNTPIQLLATDEGSARAQIEIDQSGTLHVTWDEGWDRFSGVESQQKYGVYMNSSDSGNSWTEPIIVSYPNFTNYQLSAGVNNLGGIMLVWRTESLDYPEIYYMWSTDNGETWSPPRGIPGIIARKSSTPFDKYDMATDSAGNIHLLGVGHLTAEQDDQKPPGLYHLMWDGDSWSEPFPIYEGTWYPEYPMLVIHNGNQLHATWFIRQNVFNAAEPHQVWYAHGQAQAPTVIPKALPTLTPTSLHIPEIPTPTTTPSPTATPSPTLDPALLQESMPAGAADSIYTETDDLLLLAKSLIPAALIIAVVMISIRFWRWYRGT